MKLKHLLALFLIIAGMGFFTCGFCAQPKEKAKLTKIEKTAKKYNEKRLKIKAQIENTDKLLQDADSAILVNNAEIQTSQSVIDSRNNNLKKLENAMKNLGTKALTEDEAKLLKEITNSGLDEENAKECEAFLKNTTQKLTPAGKAMFTEAADLYALESETQINTLNAYITELQEDIFAKREARKKLSIQKDELQKELLASEEKCDEIAQQIAEEKEETQKSAPKNENETPKIAMTIIVPPNAFKFVKYEPDVQMFDIQLRNARIFIPQPASEKQNLAENTVDIALADDYTLILLEEKPVVWLEEVIIAPAEKSVDKNDAKTAQENQIPAENPSTAVIYSFERLCGSNLPSKIHNPAMTEDISELKKYKELNLNTYFTFSPEEIICPGKNCK